MIELRERVSLKNLSTLRLEASARYFAEIKTDEDAAGLPELFARIRELGIPYLVIGGGSNMVFAFDEYPGCIIRMGLKGWSLGEGGRLRVAAGELVTPVAMALAKQHGLPILDRWFGLPGTWGGGIVGNAGCFGLEMAKYFVSCRVYDVHNGAFGTLAKDDMGFDYRTSALKSAKHKIILSAEFDLSTDLDPDRYRDGVEFRQLKQPKGFTCGSFFKNPYPHYAGKLIEDAGLKGTQIGGAEISTLHGNFFLNVEDASWRDVLALRDLAQATVREKFGVELVPEVFIVGEEPSGK